jgi:hypothetical protein
MKRMIRLFLVASLAVLCSVSAKADPGTSKDTVGDRLYVWAHPAGAYNNEPYLKGIKPSTIEPVDGVKFMGLKNAYFIRYNNVPAIPFDPYYEPFKSLDRVVWSLTGAAGLTSAEERKEVFTLAAKHKNITGFIMDDFFKDMTPPAPKDNAEANSPLPASLTPKNLADLRPSLTIEDRSLPLTVVVYSTQIVPRARFHLEHVDNVALWTWDPKELDHLEQNLKKLEELAPGKGILLGCYLYDFNHNTPIPVDRMKQQVDLGYRWLQQGRIKGMIFLGTPILDLGLDAVTWTRDWIATVRNEALNGR